MIRVWYHANCLDGFGAAWCLWKSHQAGEMGGPIDFQPVSYGDPVPEHDPGDQIWIVDFSWKRLEMELLLRMKSNSGVTVIDHHKTGAAELEGLSCAIFDMEKSGAVLTWEHVFPDQPVPMLLLYIQDADLWRWELDGSREFRQGLWCEPRDFEHWDGLAAGGMEPVFRSGHAILRRVEVEVERIAAKASKAVLDGFDVLMANSDGMASQIGHELAKRSESGIGVVWHLDGDTYRWELRSTSDGPDVSEIAKRRGGGGHAHAAGFQTKHPGFDS
jgi:oligoribonuclease NrnB/cAMP/cGMP phosphodiesterase (DHH superfamily)